jgi:hypothetical protein
MSKARSFRRVFYWDPGADQREAAPRPQVKMVLVLIAPSDRIDSVMPEKTHGRLSVGCAICASKSLGETYPKAECRRLLL